MKFKRYLYIILGLWVHVSAAAQIKFMVTVDTLLLPDQPIYMASSLNDWNPKDPEFKLKKINANTYSIELEPHTPDFEYKFTQGDWNIVEGTKEGSMISNRYFSNTNLPTLIQLHILGWEDRPEFELHVTKIPDNTPNDATIYVSGNFNNWTVKDDLFRLKKQFDGSYKIKIYSKFDQLEFKFNRGDWNSAESWKSGRARPNRVVSKSDLENNRTVTLEIENWEDLTSTFNYFSLMDLLLLFAAFQGFLLMIAIPSMQDFNKDANRLLVVILGIASFFIFFRVIGYYREVANSLPKLILLPNFVLFIYAPLFYFYIQKLLFKESLTLQKAWPHFVLPFLQLLIYIPYLFMEGKRFQHKIVNNEHDLKWVFAITFIIALFSNTFYYFKSKKALKKYSENYIFQTAYHQSTSYLSTSLLLFLICILLGVFTVIIFVYNWFTHGTVQELIDNSISLIWLAFSTIGFLLGYYAIHQPEIFKINASDILAEENEVEQKAEPEVVKTKASFNEDDLNAFKEQIEEIMKENKPFLNPNLTLNDLANLMKMPSHVLSKVIKEGYNKNFFDFVNSYRIEEFKANISNPKYQNYTLLGIAFEVGFNSKTAFNRSFKKMTNQTPSEYYQSRK